MRKREQCKQQDGFANFGDRTPVSGHDRMTNIDVPRAGERSKLAKIIVWRFIKINNFNKLMHLTRILAIHAWPLITAVHKESLSKFPPI